jgi:Flp pilus assembly protein TadG
MTSSTRIAREWLSRLVYNTSGAEIAEAAAVLPLMFMVLLGIFWFGQAFSIYGAITRAAQEGARAGSYSSFCATCGTDVLPQRKTNAVNAIQAALQASHLDPSLAQQPTTPPTFTQCLGGTPSCDAAASAKYCIQAPVRLAIVAGATNACGISVSLQYPFQFWLPFASLNKQKIWITSSALVRLEDQ